MEVEIDLCRTVGGEERSSEGNKIHSLHVLNTNEQTNDCGVDEK